MGFATTLGLTRLSQGALVVELMFRESLIP